jgi:hypothetical protein
MTTLQSLDERKRSRSPLAYLFGGSTFREHRSEIRYPSISRVSIRTLDGSGITWSAFSRDASHSGIGLLHTMPLKRGDVYEISVQGQDIQVRRKAEVAWCQSIGTGWFCSGWRYCANNTANHESLRDCRKMPPIKSPSSSIKPSR